MDSSPSEQAQTWKFKQFLCLEVLDALQEEFAELAVRFMPIKGAYLVAAGLAGGLEARRMDDIDVLVDERDFARIKKYFLVDRRLRYTEIEYPFKFTIEYPWNANPILVEFHCQLSFPQRFTLDPAGIFERSLPGQGCMVLPSAADALIITIAHAFVHIGFEMRVTLLDELRLIASQPGFTWQRFLPLVRPTGMAGFSCFLLRLIKSKTKVAISFPRGHCYARMLAGSVRLIGYDHLPLLIRRLLLELPFAKDPTAAVLAMLAKRRKRNHQIEQNADSSR